MIGKIKSIRLRKKFPCVKQHDISDCTAAAFGAAVTAKVLKWMKAGGPLAWIVGIVGGVATSVIGRIAYCIGYGALNKGCDIKASPYPWESFVSTTVR